ncbi:hypothetical protein SERLADRAFT_413300 [Serpula lacrymans var. lacrymans S7.9]|uniref:Uncharacterized protein n=1 Tax=Serpula lacrymans var. lacrymans (strain S7.9) TaxID=578457 RepID=F8NJY2_SERL9|nr:uncharacterized protein SERLADRAFT_413300 [Serpula lacrymans var. lacrymans S7.9]EGO28294.1 hypothetical protein SERLADRAFT_413300 [Serpula lacrymans var. lacrymans S7.9]
MSSHTTLQAPSAEQAPNRNIVLLKAAVRDIEEMKITHLAFKDLTDKNVKILNAKNLLLKQDNLQMKANIENLKKQVDFLKKNLGVECVEYDNDGEDQATEQVNNNDASTTQSLTDTNISLSNIDLSSVDLETLPPEQKEIISLEVADSKIVKINRKQNTYPISPPLSGKKVQAREKESEAAQLIDDDDDEIAISVPVSKAHRNSRAQSKCDQRIRKWPLLAYTDPKYDAAFIINTMSDNEDDPDYRPTSNEPKTFRTS